MKIFGNKYKDSKSLTNNIKIDPKNETKKEQ